MPVALKFLQFSILILLLGCDKVGTFEASESSGAIPIHDFQGIKSYNVTSNGKLVINWDIPKVEDPTSLRYEIFMDATSDTVETSTAGALQVEDLSLEADKKDGSLWTYDKSKAPSAWVAPLAQINSARFYQVEETLFPDTTYLFQVHAIDEKDIRDENSRVLVYRVPSAIGALGAYKGCSSVVSQTPSSVLVTYDFPEEADMLSVFNNGQLFIPPKTMLTPPIQIGA